METFTGYVLNDSDLIVATLSPFGIARDLITEKDALFVWQAGDGYGTFSAAELQRRGIVFDWSHIRDSSDEAKTAVAFVLRIVLGKRLLTVQKLVAENGGKTTRAV
jgi:hypothetical protein